MTTIAGTPENAQDLQPKESSHNGLINRSQVKSVLLKLAAKKWTNGKMTRVSKELLDQIEADLHSRLQKIVQNHPTIGKTLKP